MFPFIKSIWNAGRNVFETAKVDAIVTCMTTTKSEFLDVQRYDGKMFSTQANLPKELFPAPHHLDIIFSSDFDLVTKISSTFKAKFGDFARCESACATSDAYKLKEIIGDLTDFSGKTQSDIYFIVNTGTIDKFTSRWGLKPMTYLKDKYERPFVGKAAFNDTFGKSYIDRSKSPKLIIKGLTLLDAFIDFEGKFVPGKSTLVVPCDETDKLKRLSAVLNSKVAIFIVKAKHGSSSYNGGVTFSKEMINDIPVPESIFVAPNNLSKYVDEIIKAKQSDEIEEAAQLFCKINLEIYQHYNLTDDEIAIIESSVQ